MENHCHVSAQVSIVILVNENIYFPVGLELDKIPCNVSSYVCKRLPVGFTANYLRTAQLCTKMVAQMSFYYIGIQNYGRVLKTLYILCSMKSS